MTDLTKVVREALAKATPDWQQGDEEAGSFYEGAYAITCRYQNGDARRILAKLNTNLPWAADAHLIANAPTWLAALADRVEALEAEFRALLGGGVTNDALDLIVALDLYETKALMRRVGMADELALAQSAGDAEVGT